MTQFRWGILGTGFAARRFVLGLRTAKNAKAVAVASRSLKNAKKFAQELGIQNATDSYEEAAHIDDVDAFHIATPPSLHREHSVLCLNAGKPVLVEKPFAINANQAMEIIETARTKSVFCMEGMWTRFLPLMERVKKMVKENAIGDFRSFTGSFCIADAVRSDNNLYNLGARWWCAAPSRCVSDIHSLPFVWSSRRDTKRRHYWRNRSRRRSLCGFSLQLRRTCKSLCKSSNPGAKRLFHHGETSSNPYT